MAGPLRRRRPPKSPPPSPFRSIPVAASFRAPWQIPAVDLAGGAEVPFPRSRARRPEGSAAAASSMRSAQAVHGRCVRGLPVCTVREWEDAASSLRGRPDEAIWPRFCCSRFPLKERKTAGMPCFQDSCSFPARAVDSILSCRIPVRTTDTILLVTLRRCRGKRWSGRVDKDDTTKRTLTESFHESNRPN